MTTSWRQRAVERRSTGPAWSAQAAPALLVSIIVAIGVFEALWFGVVTHTGLALIDPGVVTWVVAHRGVGLETAAQVVTDVGSPAVVITVALLLVGWWAWTGDRRRALLGAGGMAGLVLVDIATKALVARPRPPVPYRTVVAQGYSFPSGHAMLSAGALLLVLWLSRPVLANLTATVRAMLLAGGAVAVFAVGSSRVVLGVHYPGDVLAGWTLAVLVAAALGLLDVVTGRGSS